MSKVTLSFGGQALAEYELDKEYVTVGRKSDNDIQIENMAVSGHHARLLTILNDSFLEDLNSTNGTRVNGAVIKKHALKHGDVITIGQHTLTYYNEAATQGAGSDFDRTMIIQPEAKGMPESAGSEAVERSVAALGREVAADAQGASQQPAGSARVRVTSGSNAGKELEINKALTTLGKPGAQVVAITRRGPTYYLYEIEAKDGGRPTVNGAVVAGEGVALDHGAVIEIQGVRMEFSLA